MTNVERVRTLQVLMTESVGSQLLDVELEHLRVLIRLTVEFHDYLQLTSTGPLEPRYTCESIFAGIEPFTTVTRGYKVLAGATSGTIENNVVSVASLKEQFVPIFEKFIVQDNFENKCRLLLDLFQITDRVGWDDV